MGLSGAAHGCGGGEGGFGTVLPTLPKECSKNM